MAARINISFRIPPSAFTGISYLAQHAGRLFEISDAAKNVHPISDANVLVGAISEKTGIGPNVLLELLDALSNFQHLKTELQLTSKSVLDSVTKSIEEQADKEWRDKHFDAWMAARTDIMKWLDESGPDNPIVIARKIQHLGFSHQKLLTGSSIITDVRPVFNSAASEIVEALISHVLLLEYRDGSAEKRIELAIDARDIQEMQQACERALTKTVTIRKSLKQLPFSVVVLREHELTEGGGA